MAQDVYEILGEAKPPSTAANIAHTVGRGLARGGIEAASTLAGIPRGLADVVVLDCNF